jgi:hypothetical protein
MNDGLDRNEHKLEWRGNWPLCGRIVDIWHIAVGQFDSYKVRPFFFCEILATCSSTYSPLRTSLEAQCRLHKVKLSP